MSDREAPLAFSLEWILGAAKDTPPSLTVCDLGHLRVADRTCWAPVRFATTLTSVYCQHVEHPER